MGISVNKHCALSMVFNASVNLVDLVAQQARTAGF